MDMTKQERIAALEAHAKHIRIVTLKAANHSGTNAHLGGILSILEALTVLYGAVMNDRKLPYEQRDSDIVTLPRFMEYRKELNEIVRSTMAGMEG